MTETFNIVFIWSAIISLFNSSGLLITILPLFFLKFFFNIGYYIIKNDEKKIITIVKQLEKTTFSSNILYEFGKIKQTGIFIGWKYVGMYYDVTGERESKREIYIFTHHSIFKELINEDNTDTETIINNKQNIINIKSKKNCSILIYERLATTYYNSYYEPRKFDMSRYVPTHNQEVILTKIKELYSSSVNKSTRVFISGEPGTGKSMIGLLLASEMKAKLTRTFNPTEPGETMIKLKRDLEPSEESPVIIMIDEADVMIKKIIEQNVYIHKNIPTSVKDKKEYNLFMDNAEEYNHIIFIFTSNVSKETIDTIDSSFLRKGRIDESFILTSKLV
jgi:hypothetical protein